MLIEFDVKEDYFYKEGKKEGIEVGIEVGKEEGQEEEGIELAAQIIDLHKKGKSVEAIAEQLEINISKIESIIEKFNF